MPSIGKARNACMPVIRECFCHRLSPKDSSNNHVLLVAGSSRGPPRVPVISQKFSNLEVETDFPAREFFFEAYQYRVSPVTA